ncbi:MAG: M61 family metallopeptidase [Planctomycetes bacterium]|nr:M61 family metallopeptidase [Planctomycetota bacterium]
MTPSHLALAWALSFLQAPAAPEKPASTAPATVTQAQLASSYAEGVVGYAVGMDTKAKRWTVEVSFPVTKSDAFEVWLPRWTPGAYHLADFSRFVDDFEARDGNGAVLPVETLEDPVHWKVTPKGPGRVRVKYTAKNAAEGLEGFMLDMESNRIRKNHAYLTPASLMAFVPELRDNAIEMDIALPAGWGVASPLQKNASGRYVAPSYYRLEDSPFLMGKSLRTVDFTYKQIPHTVATLYRNEEEIQQITDVCKRVVEAGDKMFGGLPYDRYTFLFALVPEGGMGALEHSYSALFVLPQRQGGDELNHIIAHEYVHLWNAERVHVETLQKPDQTQPFETGTIWMNEGATEYLSHLVLVHAGLTTREEFFKSMASNHAQCHAPMMKQMMTRRSNVEASKAWRNPEGFEFVEVAAATYQKGSLHMFAADLEIRRLSGGKRGLTDVVRTLMDEYWRKGKGYPEDVLPSVFAKVAGGDMSVFFQKYISGRELADLTEFLRPFGLRVEKNGDDSMRGKFSELDSATPEQLALRESIFSLPSGH